MAEEETERAYTSEPLPNTMNQGSTTKTTDDSLTTTAAAEEQKSKFGSELQETKAEKGEKKMEEEDEEEDIFDEEEEYSSRSTALSPDDIPDLDANYNRLTADITSNPLYWTTEEMAAFISK